jgi:hypothetical protein
MNSFRPGKRGALHRIEIFRLDGDGLAKHLDAIAEILHACVHDGANVGFVISFDLNQARDFWVQKIAPGLVTKSRVVLAAKVEEQSAGYRAIESRYSAQPTHRADVSARVSEICR